MNTLTTDGNTCRVLVISSADPKNPLALWVLADDDTTVAVPLTVQRARHLGELLLAHVASIAAGPPTGGVT